MVPPMNNDAAPHNHSSRGSESSSTSGSPSSLSKRRKFLQMSVKGAVAGLVTAGRMEFVAPSSALAQSTLTPDMALRELLKGNRRFVAGRLISFEQDLSILRNHTSELQQPFAAVLSCADSRVPVELVFDQSIGQIFVTRVAGNITTSEIIASLEYGAAVLGTKVILVMGHGNCGAVKAALASKEVPGQISALFPHLQPAVDQAGPDLEATTKANAKLQADLLRKASTVISGLIKEDKLVVLSAFYNIASGEVTLLDQTTDTNG
jgi:carbonic anhydrase